MKGFIAKMIRRTCVAGTGVIAAAGCYGYYDLVDPCYPQRYEYQSRQEVHQSFGPQVNNGHVLDQTIWNYHFEPGTATLTPAGIEHLAYLARRRPCPDPTVYLQVAQDIPYDPANFADFVEARNKLDNKRIQAIQDYLTAETSGRNVSFNVVRHDPAEVGIDAISMGTSVRLMELSAQGVMIKPTGGGGGGAPTAGH
jgi:hypothetical protein